MLDWLLALWGGVGGLVRGRVGLRHGASIRYTHCDTPGPCVTPARECKYRPHQRRSNACRGRHRGQPAPAPARVTLGAYRGPLYAHAGRRSRCVTRDTRATLGAMRPQHRGRYAHAGPAHTCKSPSQTKVLAPVPTSQCGLRLHSSLAQLRWSPEDFALPTSGSISLSRTDDPNP